MEEQSGEKKRNSSKNYSGDPVRIGQVGHDSHFIESFRVKSFKAIC